MSPANEAVWQRRCQLFDELAELEPATQTLRLAELAASEPELAVSLSALLAADRTKGVLDSDLAAIAPELTGARSPCPWATQAGLIIGNFRLLEAIGEGGMGEVWLAQREQADYDQRVVIKLLKPGLDTRGIMRRFVQERAILARLNHPHIVRVIDGGMSTEGRPWYAMDHVSGSNITDYAASQALSPRARVGLMIQVAEAVAYAHGQLVVHRDLKPANIMVDERGRPRLLDFGIAKLLQEPTDPALTRTGVRALSPAYAAPEQLTGEPISTATDVYALGLILHELLTGARPERDQRSGDFQPAFRRASRHLSTQSAEQIRSIYGAEAECRRIGRELAGDLDLIVGMATRIEPGRRYPSAEALAGDLKAWLDRRPITARGDSTAYRLKSFVRRNPGGVSAAMAVLLALLIGLGLALWQGDKARQQRILAETEAVRASEEAALASRTAAFLERLFQISDPSEARGNTVTARELLDKAVRDLETELLDQPRLRSRLMITIGLTYRSLGLYSQARSLLEAVLELQARQGGLLAEEIAVAHAHMGNLLRRLGEYAAAESHLQLALDYRRQVYGQISQPVAETVGALANLMQESGQYAQARESYQRTLDLVSALDGIESSRYALWLGNLALLESRLGDYQAAYENLSRAVEIYRAVLDPDHPDLAWGLSMLASMAQRLERSDEALVLNEEAIAIQERVLGPDHFDVSQSLNTRALLLRGLDRHEESLLALERALSAYRTSVGTENLVYAAALNNYATGLMHAGQPERAIELGFESRALLDRIVAPTHPQRIQMDYSLGVYLSAAGRDKEGQSAMDQALDLHHRHGGLTPQQLKDLEQRLRAGGSGQHHQRGD